MIRLKTLALRLATSAAGLLVLLSSATAFASEADLVTPDLSSVTFVGGLSGRALLVIGLFVCLIGLGFGVVQYLQLKNLSVHKAMREISELIYETCKTYLLTQGRFLLILEAFIGAIMVFYFGWLRHMEIPKVVLILLWSLIGIGGSYIGDGTIPIFGVGIPAIATAAVTLAVAWHDLRHGAPLEETR